MKIRLQAHLARDAYRTIREMVLSSPSGALYDESYQYRYLLWRTWNTLPDKGHVHFCMLNPSTATEDLLDPTLKRCQRFAMSWGYDGFVVTNLYAYRATNPKELLDTPNPGGLENSYYIELADYLCQETICGWGRDLGEGRSDAVLSRLKDPKALALNKNRMPRHPLYLPADRTPFSLREMTYLPLPFEIVDDPSFRSQ